MHYLKLITICLFIASCSSETNNTEVPTTPAEASDITTNNDTIGLGDNDLQNTENLDAVPVIEVIEGKTVKHKGYEFIIGESTQTEFENIVDDTITKLLTQKECIQNKRISITSEKEIELKLNNGSYLTLEKSKTEDDEQFFGYTFIHFDSIRNIYVLWENWLEAGHPIMVNAVTGKVTIIYGELFKSNISQTLTANIGEDIGSGWTPNGIQVFEIQNNSYIQLFEFDPIQVFDVQSLSERWGPVDLKWKNDNTIYMKCLTHDNKSGYLTIYKVIQFKKQNQTTHHIE